MKLFEPISIRQCTLKNRILMPGMGTNLGLRNEIARAYYEERAKGGVGTIVIGGIMPDLMARKPFAKGFYDNVAGPVQKHGAKIGPELWYGNLYPSYQEKEKLQEYVAPSPGFPAGARAIHFVYGESECFCREITKNEIREIISSYVEGAVRAKEIGFDFVEIHACHGHNLPHQFFSPLDNRRNDEYGGSLEGRMKFSIELAQSLREGVGNDFPVFWRFSAEEGLPGGYSLKEALRLSMELENAGIDLLDVSYGHEAADSSAPVRAFYPCPGEESENSPFVAYAAAVKTKVKIPVVAVGRLHSPVLAEAVLKEEKADIIAIGRQILADPQWPKKTKDGKTEQIRPCILCNHCVDVLEQNSPISCSVNPQLGRESSLKSLKPTKPKRVIVIGGGVGGMVAAIVASYRRHQVTLFEKEAGLGGQLLTIERLKGKSRIADYRQYLEKNLKRAKVNVITSCAADRTEMLKLNPDIVILATGAVPKVPSIPGVNISNAFSAIKALEKASSIGENVVVIGGGEVGCDVAEHFAEKHRKVTILESERKALSTLAYRFRYYRLYRLAAKGVTVVTGAEIKSSSDKMIFFTDRTQKQRRIAFDSLVIATGAVPNAKLKEELQDIGIKTISIGDCLKPGKIAEASLGGLKAGIEI